MRQTIGELKTPFTVADFLERVVPGFILIYVLHAVILPGRPIATAVPADVAKIAFLILISYPVGVALNVL